MLGSSLAARRLALAGCFAGLALALASVGVYGILAFAVSSRTREFGVRVTLGATRGSVLMLVVRHGEAWSLLGLGLGLAGALAGGRLLGGLLYAVRPDDPATFAAVALVLLVVVAVACVVPGRRAARVDPIASVRAE